MADLHEYHLLAPPPVLSTYLSHAALFALHQVNGVNPS